MPTTRQRTRQEDEKVEADLYMSSAKDTSPMTAEHERAVILRAKAGDQRAVEEMVSRNLRYVYLIASRYRGPRSSLDFSDLLTAGSMGILEAIKRYDPSTGNRFLSYAQWWIRQQIMAELANGSKSFRLPQNRAMFVQAVHRVRTKIGNGKLASADDVCAATGWRKKEVDEAMRILADPVYLDAPVSSEDGEPKARVETVECDTERHDVSLERRSVADYVRRCTDCLTHQQRFVVVMLYGLDDGEQRTLTEVGEMVGLTRERIRQIRNKALAKMVRRHGPGLSEIVGGARPKQRLGENMSWPGMAT